MKNRFICVLLTLVFVLCMFPVFSAAALKGDADGDGNISAADARLTLRCSVGLESFSAGTKQATDMDNDGNITASDARTILRMSVGLYDDKPSYSNEYDLIRSGKFYMNAEISSDGVNYEKAEMAFTDNTSYMLGDFDGVSMGMLITDEALYMMYHEKKSALKMEEDLMSMAGMSFDELKAESDPGFSDMPALKAMTKEENVSYKGKNCTVYSYVKGSIVQKIYMCGDSLVRMAEFDRYSNRLLSDTVIISMSAEIPESCKTVPAEYKLYEGFAGLFSFMSLLEDVM